MTALLAVIWAVGTVVLVVAFITLPSWCMAEIARIKLQMLRDDILHDIRFGQLPRTRLVEDTLEAVDLTITHYKRCRLLDVLILGTLARWIAPELSGRPVPAGPEAALTPDQEARLAVHHDHFSTLIATLFMTSSWPGLVTVLWFFARAGFRSLRAAIRAADNARVGRAARRGASRAWRLAVDG